MRPPRPSGRRERAAAGGREGWKSLLRRGGREEVGNARGEALSNIVFYLIGGMGEKFWKPACGFLTL